MANIKIKNVNNVDRLYNNVNKLQVKKTNGTNTVFIEDYANIFIYRLKSDVSVSVLTPGGDTLYPTYNSATKAWELSNLYKLGTYQITAQDSTITRVEDVLVDVLTNYSIKLPLHSRLPEGYQEVEYLQSTGTQYIELPFSGAQNLFDITYQQTELTKGCLIGAFTPWGPYSSWHAYGYYPYYSDAHPYVTLSNWYDKINTNSDLNVHRITYDFTTTKQVTYDDSITLTISSKGSNLPSLYLFARHDADNGVTNRLKAKVFSCSVAGYDFVPCYREADNKAGMIRLSNGNFYANKDSGLDFIVGPDVL